MLSNTPWPCWPLGTSPSSPLNMRLGVLEKRKKSLHLPGNRTTIPRLPSPQCSQCRDCTVPEKFDKNFMLDIILTLVLLFDGPGSVVGIANGYGLDGPGIESRWGRGFSAPVQTGPGAHPACCKTGTCSFPGVKSGRGVTLTPHPLLVPWSRKSRAIPLLLVWGVRPVQSLSACTRVHFTLPLPYGFEIRVMQQNSFLCVCRRLSVESFYWCPLSFFFIEKFYSTVCCTLFIRQH